MSDYLEREDNASRSAMSRAKLFAKEEKLPEAVVQQVVADTISRIAVAEAITRFPGRS